MRFQRSTRAMMILACAGALACGAWAQPQPPSPPPSQAQPPAPPQDPLAPADAPPREPREARHDQPPRRERHDAAQPPRRPEGRGSGNPQGDPEGGARGGGFGSAGLGGDSGGGSGAEGGPDDRMNEDPLRQPGGRNRGGPRSLRMLDLRDLASVLPPPPPPPPPSDPLRGGAAGGMSPFGEAPAATIDSPAGQDRVMDLVQRLAGPLDLTVSSVGSGVILVIGSEESQARLEALVSQMMDMNKDRIEIEVLAAIFPAGQAPELGTPMVGGKVVMRSRQTVPLRTPVPVVSIDEIQYIAGWQPIVADNSVGYETIVRSVGSGMKAEAIATPAPEPEPGLRSPSNAGAIELTLRGSLSSATIAEKSVEGLLPAGTTSLTIGLPRIQRRMLETHGTIGPAATVLAVLPGFEPDQIIVVGASARKPPPSR